MRFSMPGKKVSQRMASTLLGGALLVGLIAFTSYSAPTQINVDSKMDPPGWALLERRVFQESAPAMVEFYRKYYDEQGRVQCVLRWGADDGPDDAFENFAGWPELHALGGDDEILKRYLVALDGMIAQ